MKIFSFTSSTEDSLKYPGTPNVSKVTYRKIEIVSWRFWMPVEKFVFHRILFHFYLSPEWQTLYNLGSREEIQV